MSEGEMETLFSPSVLREMRRLNAANLPHRCAVQTPVTVKGPGGMSTQTWVDRRILPCRLATPGGSAIEQLVADRPDTRLDFTVIVEAGATVEDTARLVVVGRSLTGRSLEEADEEPYWAKLLSVIRVDRPMANEILRRVHTTDLRDDAAALAAAPLVASIAITPLTVALATADLTDVATIDVAPPEVVLYEEYEEAA